MERTRILHFTGKLLATAVVSKTIVQSLVFYASHEK